MLRGINLETQAANALFFSYSIGRIIMTIEEETQKKGLGFAYYSYGQQIDPNRGGPVNEIESH